MTRRGGAAGGRVVPAGLVMAAGLLLMAAGLPGSPSGQPGSTADPNEPTDGDRATPDWRIVEDESMLAVVTLRAGPAARLAHDHLVRATRYDALLELDPDAPAGARFEVTVQAAGLEVDREDDRAWVQDRLIELGIVEGRFQSVSAGQREDIREEMLSRGQLDADRNPTLRLRTLAVERAQSGAGEAHPWRIRLEMTIRDRSTEVELTGQLSEADGERYRIEAFGPARFTEFGIEPYSAYWGAVRNQDRFYLYLDLVVERMG